MKSAASARAEAIEGFAAVLAELRTSAGSPSFRVMAGRSRAISHTTLHEAAQGNRLPSWGTTAEFVKACGGDPSQFRERWEQANAVVCAVAAAACAPHLEAPTGPIPALPVPVSPTPPPPPVAVGVDAVPAPPPQTSPVTGPITLPASISVPLPAGTTGTAGPSAPAPVTTPAAAMPAAATPAAEATPVAADTPRRRRGWASVVGAAAVLVLPAGAVVAWSSSGGRAIAGDGATAGSHASAVGRTPAAHAGAPAPDGLPPYSAGDCPVQQPNPPKAPPAHAGDHAVLVADLTFADCDHVRRGQVFAKLWRIKNAGTVPWTGYALHRLDAPQQRDQCQTISDLPIPDTAPGQQVDVRVEVTAPPTAGFCFVRFKMVDAAGKVAFPGSRPINFQVVVDQ